ncbi:hypothetical protein LTR78_002142 [Recurvomyces mirabilis]|uniref:CENP-V/GFA domain-containing protein n=1 Tax=Recurvomyces mirabilis TaxID=574656 RepID=A0AAE1C4R3_9PEZI|nr:hypothetical protein LTR78_002142 [Recurvomyces mirabilis]KAK5160599.1 hypothetical protein LTS14_001611 [Recurvomyces mirabilis]
MATDTPMTATCHCKTVAVTVPKKPELINECQCTVCRSYRAGWAYYTVEGVSIPKLKDLKKYSRKDVGKPNNVFCFCPECYCLVCWWPADASDPKGEVGINTTFWDPKDLEYVERRISWEDLQDTSRTG